ncbi:sigma-70 family RNA polymerase sigma factor [Thermoanaerobacterium sp. DL9XJH110]|uniref:sigma-70 family RNA polymerase sigma factor n=1 Tax=Thermoanaerobacterium sp. DL9XJH110 TaxID=3386643 RepID=UPI003BB6A3C7
MKTWAHIQDVIEPDLEEIRITAWLLTGLRHEANRLVRKQKHLREHELFILNQKINDDAGNEIVELIDTIADKTDTLAEAEDRIFILEILSLLTPRQQKVIKATVFEDLTEKEVAENLGISQPAVSVIKNRALKKLKKHLSQFDLS